MKMNPLSVVVVMTLAMTARAQGTPSPQPEAQPPAAASAGEVQAPAAPPEADAGTAAPPASTESAPADAPAPAESATPSATTPADAPVPAPASSVPAEAGVSAAAPAPAAGDDLEWNLGGLYRVSNTSLGTMRIDANGRELGQSYVARHRLRFMPEVSWHGLTLKADGQLAASNLAADAPDARFAPYGAIRTQTDVFTDEALKLRKLYVDWKSPYGVVRVGRMTSQWGTGILANSGDEDHPDWSEPRMGRDFNFGDVVNRALVATAPAALFTEAAWAKKLNVAIGADWIERDERVSRADGDDGYQGIGVVRYADGDHEAGIYVAYRDLTDRNDETLNVFAYDAFGKTKVRRGELELYGTGEIAIVDGRTTLARNNAFTGEQDVQQLGYLVRLGAKYVPWQLGGDLEVGYASGDSNPSDRYVRNFTFDPDYNPSLILFDELRAAETVAAQASASDPERVGYPPTAARQLPSQGAVSNVIYVRPTARYTWRDLGARLALMYARAEEDIVDPFNSTVSGGLTRNYQGGDGSARDLGVEVDVGLDYTYRLDRYAEVTGSLQAGRLWPGAGFENAAGVTHPSVSLVFAQLIVRWLPPEEAPRS